jgi:hypothetical protein
MRILFLAVLLVACGRKETICEAARECIDTHGGPGLCLHMRCAFQDNQCASGYRFDDSAGERADMCVDQAALPDAGGPDAR